MIAYQLEAPNQLLSHPVDPHSSFWAIWKQHQSYLLNRCRNWMGGNLAHAEDALSQSMLKAWELWPNVVSELRNPKAWLIRLTHNHCVDLHRKFGRQAIATNDLETYEMTPISATSRVNPPDQNILQTELSQVLRTEIQHLPDSLRQTFTEYYLHEKTTQEIAHRLQISENNVYKRLQKARELLRHRLELYLNSNRYQQTLERQTLEAMTAVTDRSIISSPDTFRITSQCFALQPQLWFQSNSQLGWS